MLPKIIDLFSGCGGLTLGFQKVGFDIAAGVELMPEACQTITYNLDYRYGRKPTHICGDITKIEASVFADKFGEEGCIVIGGPPCQAYSMAGRAKLRSLGKERINTNDSRGYLFQDFLRFAYDLNASAVIMENVPESTSFGDMNIPETVCDSLESNGYSAYWTVLNSADFGVPQLRERLILFAVKKEMADLIELPVPTHRCPYDYKTQYQKRFEAFSRYRHFRKPNSSENAKEIWVTVGDAFSDLPILKDSVDSRYRNVKLNEELGYRTVPQNQFQKIMRGWYGPNCFSSSANSFHNNKKRDVVIFDRMKPGDNYEQAAEIADNIFLREAELYNYKEGSEEYKKLYNRIVPKYDRNKFLNKWKKLTLNKPSHTIVAHLAKDSYSHIHPTEPRGISVREAARIQSFPDDFFFNCSMGDAYKQIGNAVPPLMAYAIARSVLNVFNKEKRHDAA